MIIGKVGYTVGAIKFTPREIDVLACIAQGKTSTKQISCLLNVSPKTISIHVGNILSKTHYNTRHQIVSFIASSKEKEELTSFFQDYLLQEFLLRETLKKIGKLLPYPQPNYCIMWNKEYKENAERVSSYLRSLGVENIFWEQQKSSCGNAECWGVYFSQSLDAWIISSPSLESSLPLPSNAFLIKEKKGEAFPGFFLEILSQTLPHEWFNKITNEFNNNKKNNTNNSEKILKQPWCIGRRSYISLFVLTLVVMSGLCMAITLNPPVPLTNIHQSPEVKAHFLMRPQLYKEMEKAFSGSSPIKHIALVGPGGSGKTSLARYFIQGQPVKIMWEIRAEDQEKMKQSFVELAEALAINYATKQELRHIKNLQKPKEKEEKILLFVQRALKDKGEWMLLYDNLDNIKINCQNYFPMDVGVWGAGTVVYTSRNSKTHHLTHINSVIKMIELTVQEATELIQLIIKRHDIPLSKVGNIHYLINYLPKFPLDIAMAAYYMCELHLTCEHYVECIKHSQEDLNRHQQEIWEDVSYYKHTRFAITQLISSSLIEKGAENARLLQWISLVDSQAIPRNMLYHLEKPAAVDRFIRDLKKYSLIVDENGMGDDYTFSLHCLTQSVLKDCINYNLVDCQAMAEKFDYYVMEVIRQRKYHLLNKIINHVETLSMHRNDIRLISIGILHYYSGFYKKAAKEIEKSIQQGVKDPHKLCTLYFYKGQAHKQMLQEDESKEAFQKGIDICNRIFPTEPQRLVRFYTQLASLFRWKKDFKKAQEMCEIALDKYEKSPVKNEEDIMETYAILGGTYRSNREFTKAKDMLSLSVDIYRRHIEQYPIDYARALLMLGQVYINQGLLNKAVGLYEESLVLHQKYLLPKDIRMAWCYARLGNLYRLLGNTSKAAFFLGESDKWNIEDSASHQLRKAQTAEDLAYIYADQNQFEKARECAELTYSTYENLYGKDDTRTAIARNALAYVSLKTEHYDDAQNQLQLALRSLEKIQHPLRCFSLKYMSDVYRKKIKQGEKNNKDYNKKQALKYISQALSIVESHFSPESIYIDDFKRAKKEVENA